jgi:hypothetical protein
MYSRPHRLSSPLRMHRAPQLCRAGETPLPHDHSRHGHQGCVERRSGVYRLP